MERPTTKFAGVKPVDETPSWKATGELDLRARRLSKRHRKLLDDLQAELGGVGRREAVAALLEYYYKNPDGVLRQVQAEQFR